jgi:drug/metabolite transporter (DMT)-like permease
MNGIVLRLSATAMMAAMSACVHAAADRVPIGQMIFWRSFVAIAPIVLYQMWRGDLVEGLRPKRLSGHIYRSVFGLVSMVFSFVSLAFLPVASATALSFLTPIFTLPLAWFMLKERMSPALVAGVLVGLAGVMVMLSSSFAAGGNQKLAMIGIAAGLGYAITMAFMRVHMKKMVQTETPVSIAFYFAVVCAFVGLCSWPFGWVATDWNLMVILIGAGLFGGVGHVASMEALARAPISVLAPYDYTGMIWALMIDIFVFAIAPGWASLIGAALIIAAAMAVQLVPTGKAQANKRPV